jgi:hypothetical protein
MFSPANGVIEFTNNATTAFTALQFGGTTSSFVSLQSSGTTLTVGTASASGGGNLAVTGTLAIGATLSPTSAGTAGVTGQIAWDTSYIYICTAGGAAGSATWKKASLASD